MSGKTTKRQQHETKTVAVYTRISDDATGEEAGVSRQLDDCLREVRRHKSWKLHRPEPFEDNDLSASRYSRKRRPQYEAMIAAVERGEIDVIVAWHLDRLWRRPAELEHLIELAEAGRVLVVTLHGEYDLSDSDSRMMARVLVAVAAKASDDTSRRVKRAKQQALDDGRPMGNIAALGWVNGMTVDEGEAVYVRELTRRFLLGESKASMARWLNDEGVVGPQSGKPGTWTSQKVGVVLRSARNAGLATYQGEITGPAAWPVIVDREDFDAVRAILDDPARAGTPRRRTLLTGLVRCGLCGHRVNRTQAHGMPVLRCSKAVGTQNCGRVSIQPADLVEAYVVDRVLAVAPTLDPSRVGDAAELDAVHVEIARLEAKLAQLDDDYYRLDLMDRADWMRNRGPLRVQLDEAKRGLRARRPAVRGLSSLPERWPTMTPDQRRVAIADVVEHITIVPAGKGRRREFDSTRVKIKWRA